MFCQSRGFNMLDRIPCVEQPISPPMQCDSSRGDNKWNRNLKDDLKTAVELVFEFKEKLEKLHPRVSDIVAGWMRA